MGPVSKFLVNASTVRLVISPSSVGMVPLRAFENRISVESAVILNSDGIDPVIGLKLKSRTFKAVRSPNSVGMVPFSSLENRVRISRLES